MKTKKLLELYYYDCPRTWFCHRYVSVYVDPEFGSDIVVQHDDWCLLLTEQQQQTWVWVNRLLFPVQNSQDHALLLEDPQLLRLPRSWRILRNRFRMSRYRVTLAHMY